MCSISLFKPQETKLQHVSAAVSSLHHISEAAVVDGKKMYWQVGLQPECRNFCAFVFQGVTYRSRVLFFGLASATHIVQSLNELFCANFRLQQHTSQYMALTVYGNFSPKNTQ